MGKYVAYVGTYTHGTSNGIYVYDIDKHGRFTEKAVVPVNNPSNICVTNSGKYLISIADEGLVSFKIEEDGNLTQINKAWTNGMRGCYVKTNADDKYIFMGGHHDGKITMMRLNEDGSIGDIADEVYHRGFGNAFSEKSTGPHVACVETTPDDKYLFAVDSGLSQIRIYEIDHELGKLRLFDIYRCPLESEPRRIRFTKDGQFGYILQQETNVLEVVKYNPEGNEPLTHVAETSTTDGEFHPSDSVEFKMSLDEKYLYVSIDIYNAVAIFERDPETGLLTLVTRSYISGDFPKVVSPLPSSLRFVSLNHDSDEIMTFKINFEEKNFLMCQPPIKINQPNCMRIFDLEERK